MGNRAALKAAMPAMLLHEGWWDGWYRDVDCDGSLLDERRVRTHCEFPDTGEWHYLQHNWLSWADGREAVYEFGGRLEENRLIWGTDRFRGYGWQTLEETLMLKLDRLDVPGAYYIETINIAPDGKSRARTWQWFKDGVPWKRTLCDEARIEAPQ
ncbi:hypothetical protein P7228_10140 [Altererythrobacter arenosus]|uniref:DUF3598 domain-containing protein n=1 Tax=Altererythrobacter arenosus TaxID=3032592 RepID=A0ABY8FNJ2_9SPHN|nr:hypothetical protein [Altererythrobacter sp. CAU 1644]WFL76357.1 hypothetical protein P7228_10140 [Altererythrobacter sp. CAU 1644]